MFVFFLDLILHVFQIPEELISSAVTKEEDDVMFTVLLVTANILVIAVIAGRNEN